jgi:hypothetical protein
MKIAAGVLTLALALAGCGATHATPAPTVTVTRSAVSPSSPPPAPAAASSRSPQWDKAECTSAKGEYYTIDNPPDGAECSHVVYLGPDHGTYWVDLAYPARGGKLGVANTDGTTATEAECTAGYYPDGSAGPINGKPGKWDARLRLCLP